jgi:hypothetical protein
MILYSGEMNVVELFVNDSMSHSSVCCPASVSFDAERVFSTAISISPIHAINRDHYC